MEPSQQTPPLSGVDLHHAARTEAQRIVKRSKGDSSLIVKEMLARLVEWDIITAPEQKAVQRVADSGFAAARGRSRPESAYRESRQVLDELVANGRSSPTAVALASAMAGSYEYTDGDVGSPGVAFAKSGEWEGRLGTIGAVVGAVIDNERGAALGALIGSAVGKIVDDCLD